MRLRPIQPTQAVRVGPGRPALPDVNPRPCQGPPTSPFEWPAHPEWYERPEEAQPYDRLHVSDEQPDEEVKRV